jgi:hypothetical protein
MPDSATTKVCPMCAETIQAVAKVCPHCRHWQSKWTLQNPVWWPILVSLPILALWIATGIWMKRLMSVGQDFAEYRDTISVIESSMHYSSEEKGPTISVIGKLTNSSAFSWKEIQIETCFFDDQGHLIDTISGREYEHTVLPKSEIAFRLRKTADKEERFYKAHIVVVRSAKDARTWP